MTRERKREMKKILCVHTRHEAEDMPTRVCVVSRPHPLVTRARRMLTGASRHVTCAYRNRMSDTQQVAVDARGESSRARHAPQDVAPTGGSADARRAGIRRNQRAGPAA